MRQIVTIAFGLVLSACAAVPAPAQQPEPTTAGIGTESALPQAVVGLNFPQTANPSNQPALVVNRAADFPCLSCLAWVSAGGGQIGATATILDLHVISPASDTAFPRALVARMESDCAVCQPVAIQVQARGLNSATSVFGANFEAYGLGRASVAEFNIGAAMGGYVLDIVPVRLPDGSSSKIDAVMKVEGQGRDSGAAIIGAVIDLRVNPARAVVVIPAGQGPITVLETSDGRMKEVWAQSAAGVWGRQIIVDGVVQP